MDVWQWVLVYAAFLALVQLLIYYYLRRGRERNSVAVSGTGDPGRNGAVPTRPGLQDAAVMQEDPESLADPERDHATDVDEGATVCPHCGVRNERTSVFTYCRHCASPLGA